MSHQSKYTFHKIEMVNISKKALEVSKALEINKGTVQSSARLV